MFKLILILLFFCTDLTIASVQDDTSYEFTYEINRVYKALAISPQTLEAAKIIDDLNPHYKSSWVKEYISIDINTIHNGKIKVASSNDGRLSAEQLNNMKTVDLGTDISILIKYIPDNNLKHNDIQEEKFKITVDPKSDASFPGGQQKLDQYIEDNISKTLSHSDVEIYNVRAIQFSVTEQGEVVDAHVPGQLYMLNQKTENAVDDFLIDIICKMPKWNPATHENGTKVKQDFVLTVGDHSSCTLNLLNIRRNQL